MMNSKIKGYLLGSVAEITYGMNPLFTLPLYGDGMDPNSVLFFRYLCALPVILLMLRWRGQSLKVSGAQILRLALLGVMFALSSLTLFKSYNHMGAGIASTLLFVYPIVVALIMRVVYKERLSVTTALCMVMALTGIGLLYKGEDGSTLSLTGTVLVMVSALSYAFYIIFTNRSNVRTLPTLTITFYVLLFGWMVFAANAFWCGTLSVPSEPVMWVNVAALAVLPTAVSLICTTGAIQLIGSTMTAILGALEPLTAVFFGVVVFGEMLTGRDIVGIVLIIAGVSLVVGGGKIDVLLNRIVRMFPKRLRSTP